MNEIWKPIQGTFHEASNLGNIRSIGLYCRVRLGQHQKVKRAGKVLTTNSVSKNGYRTVWVNGKAHHVHTLVAKAFHGKKHWERNEVVRHIDGDKLNDRADNLKYCARSTVARETYALKDIDWTESEE